MTRFRSLRRPAFRKRWAIPAQPACEIAKSSCRLESGESDAGQAGEPSRVSGRVEAIERHTPTRLLTQPGYHRSGLRSVGDEFSGNLGDVKVRPQSPVERQTGLSPSVTHRENRSDQGEKRQLRVERDGETLQGRNNSEDFLSATCGAIWTSRMSRLASPCSTRILSIDLPLGRKCAVAELSPGDFGDARRYDFDNRIAFRLTEGLPTLHNNRMPGMGVSGRDGGLWSRDWLSGYLQENLGFRFDREGLKIGRIGGMTLWAGKREYEC